MIRHIEEYGSTSHEDCAALIETEDTMRWLRLSRRVALTSHLWERAYRAGAVGVMIGDEPDVTDVLLVEDVQDALAGDSASWMSVSEPLTYAKAVLAKEEIRSAPRSGGFVHLHTHSEYSALDGLSTVKELAELAAADDNPALALTDHGNCAGHPALQRACDKVGVKPIFGMEAYFFDGDRRERPAPKDVEAAKRLRNYNHLILLARDQEGLHNLWALSTEGYRDGHYHKPRIDWDSLGRLGGGITATSACLGGPLSQLLLAGEMDRARARLARLLEVFDGNFYLEIQPAALEEQWLLNNLLIQLARELSVPLVAAADGHYPTFEHKEIHKTWLACQTSADNEAYWHFDHSMPEADLRKRLEYLEELQPGLGAQAVDEAVGNTVKIAEQCEARIENKIVMPIYYRQSGYDRDAQKLREICEANWSRIKSKAHSEEVYRARFERELDLITRKKYCGYFLMVADYVCWAKDNGILVGPGRGSGAGSLIAFLMRITEVDPIKYDIIFERFITEGRETLPDFDVDFPASKRREIQGYIRQKYGEDHVLKVGTHLRYKSKGIIAKLFSALASELSPEAFADAKRISGLIGEAEAGTAGLGLSWDELWIQQGEVLEPFRTKYPKLFRLAEQLHGRLNSYGQHPAGMVVSTDGPLLDRLPLRRDEDDEGLMISQFEFTDLDTMGFIKFDILTVRTLDTLQATTDGAREHFGVEVDVYEFDLEYHDPMVWEEMGDGHTLGMMTIETSAGTKLIKRMKPTSILELSDAQALVRPGPARSGLTEAYLRRRAGEEAVSFADPRMEEFLAPTQGVMIYQEQVMQACMTLAGYDSTRADGVRRILGKKKVDSTHDAGVEFIAGSVLDGMEKDAATIMWDQMAEFAKYGFGKAHAVAYSMMTYWTAWWKVHYVVPTLTALLSTVHKERVPEFVKEARRLGVQILPPEINASGRGFKPDGHAIRYGLDAIKGVGEKAIADLEIGQPYTSFEDYLARKGSNANSGVTYLLAKIGAFDSIEPRRKGLVQRLEAEKDGSASECTFKVSGLQGPGGLPCTYDWENEPKPVNPRNGKLLKAKPLPKKCTKGCRRYNAPEPVALELMGRYTDKEIREIEQEMLGIQLSSSVFDSLEDDDRKLLRSQAELLDQGLGGVYIVAGIISRLRGHTDRTDRKMAFFNLGTEVVDIDVACFADAFHQYGSVLREGAFVLAELKRDSRGSQLKTANPLDT